MTILAWTIEVLDPREGVSSTTENSLTRTEQIFSRPPRLPNAEPDVPVATSSQLEPATSAFDQRHGNEPAAKVDS